MHFHHQPPTPNRFTFGDFINSGLGVLIYLYTSLTGNSEVQKVSEESHNIFLDENIRAAYSICIAITILILSWIIRGILDDKEAWFTIHLTKVREFAKFKKKVAVPSNKDIEDDLLEDLSH